MELSIADEPWIMENGCWERINHGPSEAKPIESMYDPNLKRKVMDELVATQSQLPLEVTDPVVRSINYFSSENGKRTLLAGFKRAGRYRAMIQRVLAQEGIPQELIYLAQLESGFSPRAVSWAAAAGMWQFVQFRGREYGLMQTAFTDDRLDPEKATRAAEDEYDAAHRGWAWKVLSARSQHASGSSCFTVARSQ